MNYAALLALAAGLSFTLPFVVGVAERAGLPRSYGISVTLALVVFVAMWLYIRWRQHNPKDVIPDITHLPNEPYVDIFFLDGVFQGERLLEQGRNAEALQVYRAYRNVLLRQGQTTGELDKKVLHLENKEAMDKQTAIAAGAGKLTEGAAPGEAVKAEDSSAGI